MKYLIAMDGGGTKTDAVLFDVTGHIVHRIVGEGCNARDVGVETAKDRLKDIFMQLVDASPDKSICGALCGIAGKTAYEKAFVEEITGLVSVGSLKMANDIGILISGMLGAADGCGMVCGTGSSLGVRKNGNLTAMIGGRGYLIDAQGSGYSMAREGLYRAVRALDGRDEHTVLVDLFREAMGKPLFQAIDDIYAGGRRYIASFAHLIFEGREMGDPVCEEIIETGSFKMAELTWAAAKHFEGEFPVIMGGGLFAAYPQYAQLVKDKASPRAKMIIPDVPPVYGAAVEAMGLAGMSCGEGFKENFLRDYAVWRKSF